jgi:putative oxidoreductase
MAKAGGSNWGTLIPRFLLATVFVFHGGQKLFGLFGAPVDPAPIGEMAKLIGTWGWPMPNVLAYLAAITEFFGGACLAVGLLTRFWALALAIVMGVAAWKVHLPHGFGITGGGWEYAFVLGVLCLSLVVQGGGAFSMDEMFFKGKPGPEKPPP